MPSFLDISSIGPDFEMGSLRALILNPCWVCEKVEASASSGDGKGSDIGPLNDIAVDKKQCASTIQRQCRRNDALGLVTASDRGVVVSVGLGSLRLPGQRIA